MYATIEDLRERFGQSEILQLTDRDGDSVEDTNVVTRAIADADAMIDSYIGARYAVPLSPVPAVITATACDIARFRLWTDEPPEGVSQQYRAARDFLQRLSDGKAVLTDAQGKVDAAGTDDVFVSTAGTTRFDRDTLGSFLGDSKP